MKRSGQPAQGRSVGAKARVIALLIGVAAVLLAAAGLIAFPASASAVPVVYGVPYGHAGSNFADGRSARPAGSCGPAMAAHGSPSAPTAAGQPPAQRGSATVHVRSCWGSCFRYKTGPTALHFYRVMSHNGQRYFTRLHFSLAHKVAGLGSNTLVFWSHGSPAWYYRC